MRLRRPRLVLEESVKSIERRLRALEGRRGERRRYLVWVEGAQAPEEALAAAGVVLAEGDVVDFVSWRPAALAGER